MGDRISLLRDALRAPPRLHLFRHLPGRRLHLQSPQAGVPPAYGRRSSPLVTHQALHLRCCRSRPPAWSSCRSCGGASALQRRPRRNRKQRKGREGRHQQDWRWSGGGEACGGNCHPQGTARSGPLRRPPAPGPSCRAGSPRPTLVAQRRLPCHCFCRGSRIASPCSLATKWSTQHTIASKCCLFRFCGRCCSCCCCSGNGKSAVRPHGHYQLGGNELHAKLWESRRRRRRRL
mmetsp:Transcript_88694/g.236085  ORF Transcript_88694/g.236085 Transcript_88694/m.236085 type:complete len:233 (+) Transcript_88694:842-1540(+)